MFRLNVIKSRFAFEAINIIRNSTTTTHGNHYQYMQESKLPTLYFQRSLPRLPIPLLEKTCERFLSAVHPITTPEEYAETQQVVEEFRQEIGMELQAKLKIRDTANKHTSYIAQPWLDGYLSSRVPLPLNYNPYLAMYNETRPEYKDQVVRATNLIISSLRFWRSLQAHKLKPEVYHMNPKKTDTDSYSRWMSIAPKAFATYASSAFKAFPMDMSQYKKLLGTSRIPRLGKDELMMSPDSKHIMVMRRGNIYAMNVLDSSGYIESPSVILGRLRSIIELDSRREAASVPLGVLTTSGRDEWAKTRDHIMSNPRNAQVLREVDTALFSLSLDGAEDGVNDKANPVPSIKDAFVGKGTNRWFDKFIQLLISVDGTASINMEHSGIDGTVVSLFMKHICEDSQKHPHVSSATPHQPADGDTINVRPLNLKLDGEIRAAVIAAYAEHERNIGSLDLYSFQYPHFKKAKCQQLGLSPDSIVQLSFQLAYRQAFNRYVGTYESCKTSRFKHGRTETIRSCTMATKDFCEAVLQPPQSRISPKELRDMIYKCSSVHRQLSKEASHGQGFDRHLLALRSLAQVEEKPLPKIFECEAYKRLNYTILSTSTVNPDVVFCCGPVVRDGLGISYWIRDEDIGAIVTSHKGHCDGRKFTDSLEWALDEIKTIIRQTKDLA